ncbi:hypothetical protein ACJ6WD_35365 [Streptomyces sp. VTCC 41912]|uniref:hypothetical protein n=1 Tax=Streptomyces sp. VTCC 41912 TaxID=3383243 RepID=UPI003896B686
MHDPATPPPSSPQPPSQPSPDLGGDEVGYEVALEILRNVLAWYSEQLLLARRSGDQQRLEELKARRLECVEDQHRLREAGPEETARITAVYAALLKELEAAAPPQPES